MKSVEAGGPGGRPRSLEPPYLSPWAWILAAVTVKAVLFILTVALSGSPAQPPRFHLRSGDERDYLEAVENLIRRGRHTVDPDDPQAAAFRKPGYSLTLLPFRLAFGVDWGINAQVAYQVLMGALSAYAAAAIALTLTRSTGAFLLALAFATFSMTASVFDAHLLTDGLASSVLTILTWLLVCKTHRPAILVTAGVLFTYLLFMRPFLAPLGVPFAIFIVARGRGGRLAALACFVAIPALVECAWTARNWLLIGRFIPFQTAGYELPPLERSARDWMTSFGGDYIWWRPGTLHAWLRKEPHFAPVDAPIPAKAYTTTCTRERVESIAGLYREALAEHQGRRPSVSTNELIGAFDDCKHSYEKHEPFDHHVVARLRLLKSFLVHSGNVAMLSRLEDLPWPSWAAGLKIWAAIAHAVVLVVGIPGLVLLFASHRHQAGAMLVAAIPVYIVFLFPIFLRYTETRWLALPWPMVCVAAAVAMVHAGDTLRREQRQASRPFPSGPNGAE